MVLIFFGGGLTKLKRFFLSKNNESS